MASPAETERACGWLRRVCGGGRSRPRASVREKDCQRCPEVPNTYPERPADQRERLRDRNTERKML